MAVNDTIYARSSGAPPAAIGVVRISGPAARQALETLAGPCPAPRRASLRTIRSDDLEIDRALVLFFPGPNTATGEDLAEIHGHGGRAVLAAIEAALSAIPGLRRAEPGEFTRRAFLNGVMDLAEAEGLADLLSAETEAQRRTALANASGALSRVIDDWLARILMLGAQVEAILDFSDEDDLGASLPAHWRHDAIMLRDEINGYLARPVADRLRDGLRVVLAGPPNAGKSSLFNALLDDEAAIVTPIAGTTRDALERPISMAGIPFVLVDTAGIRDTAEDIERLGIAFAQDQVARADIVLWLGKPCDAPSGALLVRSKSDLGGTAEGAINVSSVTAEGLADLVAAITERARGMIPAEGAVALNARQREHVLRAAESLDLALGVTDLLLIAEELRQCRLSLDAITGRASTEDMLDSLFGRFCIGK